MIFSNPNILRSEQLHAERRQVLSHRQSHSQRYTQTLNSSLQVTSTLPSHSTATTSILALEGGRHPCEYMSARLEYCVHAYQYSGCCNFSLLAPSYSQLLQTPCNRGSSFECLGRQRYTLSWHRVRSLIVVDITLCM